MVNQISEVPVNLFTGESIIKILSITIIIFLLGLFISSVFIVLIQRKQSSNLTENLNEVKMESRSKLNIASKINFELESREKLKLDRKKRKKKRRKKRKRKFKKRHKNEQKYKIDSNITNSKLSNFLFPSSWTRSFEVTNLQTR